MGGKPLCMKQFYDILAGCRIPGIKKDQLVHFPPDQPNPPKHIIVMHNNHVSNSRHTGMHVYITVYTLVHCTLYFMFELNAA